MNRLHIVRTPDGSHTIAHRSKAGWRDTRNRLIAAIAVRPLWLAMVRAKGDRPVEASVVKVQLGRRVPKAIQRRERKRPRSRRG